MNQILERLAIDLGNHLCFVMHFTWIYFRDEWMDPRQCSKVRLCNGLMDSIYFGLEDNGVVSVSQYKKTVRPPTQPLSCVPNSRAGQVE